MFPSPPPLLPLPRWIFFGNCGLANGGRRLQDAPALPAEPPKLELSATPLREPMGALLKAQALALTTAKAAGAGEDGAGAP